MATDHVLSPEQIDSIGHALERGTDGHIYEDTVACLYNTVRELEQRAEKAEAEVEAGTAAMAEAVSEVEQLRAKLEAAEAERDEAEELAQRRWQDRYDALNAQTTEGMSAAEWQMRTGTAERRVAELEAERDRLEALWHQSKEGSANLNQQWSNLAVMMGLDSTLGIGQIQSAVRAVVADLVAAREQLAEWEDPDSPKRQALLEETVFNLGEGNRSEIELREAQLEAAEARIKEMEAELSVRRDMWGSPVVETFMCGTCERRFPVGHKHTCDPEAADE